MKLFSGIAYHSTKQKGLKKFDSFTTKAKAFTGEGAQIHGWGLYLQADRKDNQDNYLLPLADFSPESWYPVLKLDDKTYYGEKTEDYCGIDEVRSMPIHNWYTDENFENPQTDFDNFILDVILDVVSDSDFKTDAEIRLGEWIANYDDEDSEYSNHISINDLQNTLEFVKNANISYEYYPLDVPEHFENASQYEIEIPDDMIFIDEDKQIPKDLAITFVDDVCSISATDAYGKKQYIRCKDIAEGKYSEDDVFIPNNFPKDLEELLRSKQKEFVEDIYKKRDSLIENVRFDNGKNFYYRVNRALSGQEKASLWLLNHGIDGIEYEGGRDGGCMVIFNCDKLKILNEY